MYPQTMARRRLDNPVPNLTITMDEPEGGDVRSEADGEPDVVVTAEQALAVRPRAGDPTHLENGTSHPRYIQWLVSHNWAEQHPLSEYLSDEKHVKQVCDERGYFDRKRVNRTLGPSGSKIWLVDGPLPSKAKIPALAELLDVPVAEVQDEVEKERKAREDYKSMLNGCRHMPYKLMTYEQVMAGLPCPGCGRPWIGQKDELDTDDTKWREIHGECHAGRNGYHDGPIHCLRCCGTPPLSPGQIEKITRILKSAAERREWEEQQERMRSTEAKREQEEKAAKRRAAKIRKLEAELERLRAEEAAASEKSGRNDS